MAYQHLIGNSSEIPIHTENDLDKLFKYYDMPRTSVAVGTFVSDQMDLDLRLQHWHNFSESNWGGHYHHDTTPDTIEYEAYFNLGDRIIRIDQPNMKFLNTF